MFHFISEHLNQDHGKQGSVFGIHSININGNVKSVKNVIKDCHKNYCLVHFLYINTWLFILLYKQITHSEGLQWENQ